MQLWFQYRCDYKRSHQSGGCTLEGEAELQLHVRERGTSARCSDPCFQGSQLGRMLQTEPPNGGIDQLLAAA